MDVDSVNEVFICLGELLQFDIIYKPAKYLLTNEFNENNH